eukprot:14226576-Alexandrium_andersonii.AAC.1
MTGPARGSRRAPPTFPSTPEAHNHALAEYQSQPKHLPKPRPGGHPTDNATLRGEGATGQNLGRKGRPHPTKAWSSPRELSASKSPSRPHLRDRSAAMKTAPA